MESKQSETTFKSVSGLAQGQIIFVDAAKLLKAGTTGVVAEGTYEGSMEKPTKYGPKLVYKIRAANGDLYHVTNAGNLKYRMGQAIEQGLTEGTPIQVSYLGQSKMVNGPFKGTLAHSFDVAIEVLDNDDAA